MLSTDAASLAISIARGLIKLGGRLDVLMAERTATEGKLVIPMPPVSVGPPLFKRAELLQEYLAKTAGEMADPLGPDRATLAILVAKTPTPNEVDVYFRRIFPKLAEPPLVDPDAEYLKVLKTRLPTVDWSDPSTREAAFAIASGRDTRELGYAARTALLVVDTLAEFGAENTSRFVRDPNLQAVVQSVLERFARPQLEDFEQWNPFLRHALSATLNGALDASGVFLGRHEWLDAVLTALTQARADAAGGDDFVLGLLHGRGYSLLISEGLAVAGSRLSSGQAPAFQQITAEVLLAAAPLVKANKAGFAGFFREHWGDLFRAGLVSVAAHGPVMLQGQSPLLKETLLAMLGELAKTTDSEFFTTDTAFKLTEAALGAVARNPDLLNDAVKEAWFRELIAGAAKTLSDDTIRATLTREGLESLVLNALSVLAAHPELLVSKPGRRFDLVSAILKSVSGVGSLDARALATAAVTGALDGLARQPHLLDTRYGDLIAELTGALAKLVAARGITGGQAADLVTAASEAILRNPELFTRVQDNVAVAVVNAVLAGAKTRDSNLLAGPALVETTRAILEALALRGRDAVANTALKDLTAKLTEAVTAGLKRGEKQLGLTTDRARLPAVLGGLVAVVLQGNLTVLDPDNAQFVTVFDTLAEAAA
jgi:hypothetical protein